MFGKGSWLLASGPNGINAASNFLALLPLLFRPKVVLSNPFETCLSLGDPATSDLLSLFKSVREWRAGKT